MDTPQRLSIRGSRQTDECNATKSSSLDPFPATNFLLSDTSPTSSNATAVPKFVMPALQGASATPNADKAFNWPIPHVRLVPPSGPPPTKTESRYISKQSMLASAGKRKRELQTLSHFSLNGSRIPPPKFYSTHLNKSQILSKVVKCSGLHHAFAALVDRYIQARSPPDLPHIGQLDTFSVRSRKQYESRTSDTQIQDEHGIGQVYAVPEEMAARIASTLFINSREWTNALNWTTHDRHGMAHAIADGYLYISDERYNPDEALHSNDAFRELLAVHVDQPSPGLPIMIWVFVPVGDPFGMAGDGGFSDDGMILDVIEEMADRKETDFAWTSCEKDAAPHASCNSSNHLSASGAAARTGHSQTRDATCTLALLQAAGQSDDEIRLPSLQSTQVLSTARSPHLVKRACHVVQRAWTTAVAVDATYVVFTTGNREIFGVRKRDSGTFCMSKSQEVARDCKLPANKPPHLKVHSGIMLAALEDIRERVAFKVEENPKVAFDIDSLHLPPLLWKKKETPRHLRWNLAELAMFFGSQKEVRLRWPKNMIVPTLTGMQQPYAVQRSEAHNGFHYDYYGASSEVDIMLQVALDQNTFRCHPCRANDTQPIGNYFVVKFAKGGTDTAILRAEADVYHILQMHKRLGGVPQCFGYFENIAAEDNTSRFSILLMEECPKSLNVQTRISERLKDDITKWLDKLHAVGLVHTRLSPAHIMIDEQRHESYFRIISWKNAAIIRDPDTLNETEEAGAHCSQDRKDLQATFQSVEDPIDMDTQKTKRLRLESDEGVRTGDL